MTNVIPLRAEGIIQCSKPYYYVPKGGWEIEHERGQKPVIAILNPQLVYAALTRKSPKFVPVPARLEAVMKIPEKCVFELPDVRDGAFDSVVFLQGQHRTTALAMLGFSAYPTVTTDVDAQALLEKFGASIEEAEKRFDWSRIKDYPTLGR
jgi:hypothetical protein